MKHAILILAHNNFNLLAKLIHQLDDEHFDIFLHVDAKAVAFSQQDYKVKNAHLTFIPRISVGYCDYTMMDVVKALMLAASQTYHDYYHVISGVDMMIKTREEFFAFFEEKKGHQFVAFTPDYQLDDRVKYRHYFIAKWRQKSHWKSVFYIRLRKMLISLQKVFGLSVKPDMEVKKGADWYSITHDAVQYMLSQEPHFRKYFYRSYCPTEFFPQTVLWNSPYRDQLYNLESKNENAENMRQIDWDRGSPYTYRIEDKEILLNSPYMFARKFDEKTDSDIIEFMEKYVAGGIE